MSSILNQSISPDISLSWVNTSDAQKFGDVLFEILRRYEQFIVPENPETSWADRQKPSVNIPLRSAFIQQVQVSSLEIDKIEGIIRNWLIAEEESDKLRWRYISLSERQRDGLIRDRTESQIAKIRVHLAQEMQRNIFGGEVDLTWFVNEEKIAEKLRKIFQN